MTQTEKIAPDYSEEIPEIIPVYCWKVDKHATEGIYYVVFFDRKSRMYRTATSTIRFKESNHYLIKPKHSKLKKSSGGKPYFGLHGVHIVSKLSKQDYLEYDQAPPESKYAYGEVVKWISVDEKEECTIKESVIIEMEYDKIMCLWKYLVQGCDEKNTEAVIMEMDIIDEGEKQ